MASPQPDKFTAISNELLEHVAQFKFNGSQFRIILIVWRFTYGFRRKEHEMSIDFIAEATKLHPTVVKRELKKLIDKKAILVVKQVSGKQGRIIAFNKDYEQWQPEGTKQLPQTRGSESVTSEGTKQLPREGTNSLPKKEKKENSKERSTSLPRNKKIPYSEDSKFYQMAMYFHSKIMEHAEANKVGHLVRDADLQKWADEFRKIIEIDKRERQELKAVIDWSTTDSFWQVNILSPVKLRKQYVQLAVKMNAASKHGGGQGRTRDDRNKALLQRKMEEARKENEQSGDVEASVLDLDGLPDGRTDR